jgi:hypothetical protein
MLALWQAAPLLGVQRARGVPPAIGGRQFTKADRLLPNDRFSIRAPVTPSPFSSDTAHSTSATTYLPIPLDRIVHERDRAKMPLRIRRNGRSMTSQSAPAATKLVPK